MSTSQQTQAINRRWAECFQKKQPFALTESEWRVMKTQPELGLAILGETGRFTREMLAVLYHLRRHEPPAVPAAIFFLALFVAVGRFSHWA